MSTPSGNRLSLRVTDVMAEAKDVVLVELKDPNGHLLPAFDPGAHLEVELGNGMLRHYSLTNDSRQRDRYVVGVGRAVNGRGGSEFVHQELRRGVLLNVSTPRNNFRLDPSATSFLFIAGGIGITPIVSMIQWCEVNDRIWKLVYAVRNAQRAAFYETLARLNHRVAFHFDDQHGRVLDVAAVLGNVGAGEHVYCCGPRSMMAAVKEHSTSIESDRVHFEIFNGQAEASASPASGAFTVTLRRSGRTLLVPPESSILEVLEANGFILPYSCREGLCRTCETAICEGQPDHRDFVLSSDERRDGKTMMICVSRAGAQGITLDL